MRNADFFMFAAATTNSRLYASVFEQMSNGICERGVNVVQQDDKTFLAVLPTTVTHPLPPDLQLQYDTFAARGCTPSSIPLINKNIKRSKKRQDML